MTSQPETLTATPCRVCDGSGAVPEDHDGGTHPVDCPCTYELSCAPLCRCKWLAIAREDARRG